MLEIFSARDQGQYNLNSSVKAFKSEYDDPPSSTAVLAISPSAWLWPLLHPPKFPSCPASYN